MGVIDDIKDKLDIVQIVQRRVQLKKAGRNWVGSCPFHLEKTPSFTVFPESQRWKCFGCGQGGDLLDFVMAFDQVEMKAAMQELAREAGVPWEESAEQVKAAQTRREREAILGAAASYFQKSLLESSEAMTYARERGWSNETIEAAQLGYWGGDWLALRKALTDAGVDLGSKVAQAVLKIPPGMLIYVHSRAGRVHYLSGRSISEKRHFNLPQELAGDKHPFFNQVYRRAVPVVVVEGQADAITLGQWDISAIALAGCHIGTGPARRLLEVLVRHGTLTLGLDPDPSGQAGAAELAEALMGEKLSAVRIRVVRWPGGGDANNWLQQGGTQEEAKNVIEKTPCWLEETLQRVVQAATQADRRPALEAAARAYGSLDAVDQVAWRRNVCNQLDITSMELRQLMEAVGAEEDGALQTTDYAVQRGMICRVNYGERGQYYQPLCNFTAHIVEDVVEDDGEESLRRFVVEGELAKGGKLPAVEVEAEDFGRMNWVLSQWGARAAVAAGTMAKDHLRVALLTTSEPSQRYEYAHLGWRKLNGHHVYLSAAGAVGMDGVQVRLPRDLESYRLPIEPDGGKGPIEASLRFLETGDHRVTMPLWAAMYLAPLASVLPPSFTLWLFGTTGSLKSTTTALALCHFGHFVYNTPPASWTGTANALEKKAFVVKDAPLWIDDYTTQSTMQGQNEIRKKADQLLRDWGNRAGRSRMQADLSLRRTFVPRGLIISTAEQLPAGQSILSRLFTVEISPQMMTRGEDSNLSLAQLNDQQLYPHAMAGYLSWLATQYGELEEKLRQRHLRYVEAARREDEHLRMPGNVATLFLGFEMGLFYARERQVLGDEDVKTLREEAWRVLMGIGEQQHQVVAEEKPVEMYLSALDQMFANGTAYLRNKTLFENNELCWPTTRAVNAEHLGWYDEQYWYLLSKTAYGAVWRFYRGAGVVFPDTERGVRVKLAEQGLLFPDSEESRTSCRLRLGDTLHRVLRIARPNQEESPEGA